MTDEKTIRLYGYNIGKYLSLLNYIKKLRDSGKLKDITRSQRQAIINRYRRLSIYLKRLPLRLTFAILPSLSAMHVSAQCTDISINPILLNLSMSGTNALGANASPAFSDIDGDGLEDMVVAAWPGIEVYKREPSNYFKLMYGDESNPFGNIATLQQSVITFYDIIIDDTDREEMFLSFGTSGMRMYIYDPSTGDYRLSTDAQNPFNFIDFQFHASPIIYTNFGSDIIQALIIDSDGRVHFYAMNSAGKFEEINTVDDLVDEDYRNPYLLDLNGDLFHETLIIGKTDGSIEYLEFNGFTYIEVDTNPFDEIVVDDWAKPVFNDLDGDGDLDLVVGDQSGRVHTYTNVDFEFTLNENSKDPLDGVIASDTRLSPTFYDWNCDGEIDIFIGGRSGRIEYIRNLGGEYFDTFGKNPFEGLDFGSDASLAFLDEGDGNHPIAIVGSSDGRLRMLSYNDTEGLYEEMPDHSLEFVDVGDNATPTLVDLDLDGDEDLFVGAEDGYISYFRNLGNGNFQQQTGSSNPFNDLFVGRSSSVVFMDVNDDGAKDAFVRGSQGIKYFNYTFSGFIENENNNPFRNLEITGAAIRKTNLIPNNKFEIVLSTAGSKLLTFQSFNNISTSCYRLDDCLSNNWIGDPDEAWNDSPLNWSLGRVPLPCDAVNVISNKHLRIPSTTNEECNGLIVGSGGTLSVDGELTVHIEN